MTTTAENSTVDDRVLTLLTCDFDRLEAGV